MARIISISYDETLLRTRHLMLEQAGHQVTSAVGFHDAKRACENAADLIIIGHSIPKADKLDLISSFRSMSPNGTVVALTRAGEDRLKEVDAYINPGDPEELLRAIRFILDATNNAERRHWNVRPIR